MTVLFQSILEMSLLASYVAAAVILLRLLLKKAPRIFTYCLWGVLLFRLVCPFSFESMFSLIPSFDTANPVAIPPPTSAISNGNLPVHNLPQRNPVQEISTVNAQSLTLMDWLGVLWMVGMFLLLCYSIFTIIRLHRRLKSAIHLSDNIYEAENIQAPFVMGIFKPKIYLSANIAPEELPYILKHEQTHIKRLDYLIKPLAFLVLILHWFNPLMWICYFLMVKDMELSCDESVLRHTEEDIRRDYSATLLALSTKQSGLFTPLAFGESNVKTRIKNILNYKKPAFWVILVTIVAVLIAGIGLLTNPKGKELDLSFLDPNNLISSIIEMDNVRINDTNMNGYTYLSGRQTGEWIDRAEWKETKSSAPYAGTPTYIIEKLNGDIRSEIRLYKENSSTMGNLLPLAMVYYGNNWRCYTIDQESFAYFKMLVSSRSIFTPYPFAFADTVFRGIERYDSVNSEFPDTVYALTSDAEVAELNRILNFSSFEKADDKSAYDIAPDIVLLAEDNLHTLSLFGNVEGKTYAVYAEKAGTELGKYFAPPEVYNDLTAWLNSISAENSLNTPEEIFISQLLSSADLSDNQTISFTIPPKIPDGFSLSLQVSGRQKMGEDGMSFHAFPTTTESRNWEAGKTYKQTIVGDSLLSCDLFASLNNGMTPGRTVKGTKDLLTGNSDLVVPPQYAIVTLDYPVPASCTHFEWEHTFDINLISHVGTEKFNKELRKATDDSCGDTIYDFMAKFNMTTDEFLSVTKDTNIYKDLEKYRKNLTDFTVASSKPVATGFTIELVMTKGIYAAGRTLEAGGGIYENNYIGDYELQTKSNGLTHDRLALPPELGTGNNFDKFEILVDYYNTDGNPDFTLGYWGGSNGKIYKLYSAHGKERTLSVLNEEGYFVANHDFSIQFEKLSPTSFTYDWYNNADGKTITEVVEWKDGKFVQKKQ